MRAAPCLLAIALLALPFASADQSVSAGPATVTTQSAESGDGCTQGGNGSSTRAATAEVAATEDESFLASFSQYCYESNNTWTHGNETQWQRWSSQGGGIFVGRTMDGNPGPFVNVYYSDSVYEDSWGGRMHYCGSGVYASGPVIFTGCYPDGGRWPMVPALP